MHAAVSRSLVCVFVGTGVVVTSFFSYSARAHACPTIFGQETGLAAISATERFAFIDRNLAHTERYGRTFDYAWGFGFAGTAILQAAVGYTQPIAFVDDGQQKSLYVSAAKTTVGALAHLVRPTRVYRPTWNPDDPCGSVAEAEKKLSRTARLQRKRTGWRAHAEGLLLNLSGTLYLGFGHDLWKEALSGFAIGFVVGQIRLYTYPRHAIRAWKRYRTGDISTSTTSMTSLRDWQLVPMATSHGMGFAIVSDF